MLDLRSWGGRLLLIIEAAPSREDFSIGFTPQ